MTTGGQIPIEKHYHSLLYTISALQGLWGIFDLVGHFRQIRAISQLAAQEAKWCHKGVKIWTLQSLTIFQHFPQSVLRCWDPLYHCLFCSIAWIDQSYYLCEITLTILTQHCNYHFITNHIAGAWVCSNLALTQTYVQKNLEQLLNLYKCYWLKQKWKMLFLAPVKLAFATLSLGFSLYSCTRCIVILSRFCGMALRGDGVSTYMLILAYLFYIFAN